jgi:outer membrane protein TolC
MKLHARSAIGVFSTLAITTVILASSALAQQRVYTLKTCIDMALSTSISVVKAEDGVRQAKADLLATKGAFLPDLNAGLSRSDYANPLEKGHSYGASIRSGLVLFDGLARYWNLVGANASLSASKHDVAQARLDAAYNVKSIYFGLLLAQSTYEISKKALERSQELMKIAETKFELGSASRSDVLKAKVSLAQAQLDLLTAENSVKTSQANLSYAIGEPVDQEITVQEFEMSAGESTFEEAYAEALDRNPSYLSALENLRASKYSLRSVRGDYWPRLSVDASKNWSSEDLGDTKEFSRNYNAELSTSLSFNIFNRLQTKRQTDVAKANIHTAEYLSSDTRRTVQLEVRESHLNLTEKSKARELSDEKLASAEEDYKLAQEKYTLGAATILDILNAEVSLRTAESDKIQSKYDYYLAVARMQKAIGNPD